MVSKFVNAGTTQVETLVNPNVLCWQLTHTSLLGGMVYPEAIRPEEVGLGDARSSTSPHLTSPILKVIL